MLVCVLQGAGTKRACQGNIWKGGRRGSKSWQGEAFEGSVNGPESTKMPGLEAVQRVTEAEERPRGCTKLWVTEGKREGGKRERLELCWWRLQGQSHLSQESWSCKNRQAPVISSISQGECAFRGLRPLGPSANSFLQILAVCNHKAALAIF